MSVEVAHVRVQSFGIQTSWASSAWWATVGGGARGERRVTRALGLFARADALVPLGAPRFALETETGALRLYSPWRVAPRWSLGAELIFP